jgi:predicted nucleotide-binding protein
MARRSAAPPPPQAARLTAQAMRAGIDRLRKRIEEVKQFSPQTVTDQYNIPEIDGLAAAIDDAFIRTFGANSADYTLYKDAVTFDNGPHNYAYEIPINLVQQSLARSKARSIVLLEQAVRSLEERLAEEAGEDATAFVSAPSIATSRKIFVVHGHDDGAREGVARFLEKIGLEAIILREQPNRGRTIIEKFVDYAREVGFAVVLLTPDDLGGAAATEVQQSRARQNVIFELGYFVGSLGRGRACLLRKGEVEIPSDLYGVVYTNMDGADGWKIELARELKDAGFEFDAEKVLA